MVIVHLGIRKTATSQQLKDLGDTLDCWCDAELDLGECCPEVEEGTLKDLLAGELPKPRFLRMTAFLGKMDKARRILGVAEDTLEPYQRKELQDELGQEAQNRDVVIFIDCVPGFSYETAIERLRNSVSKGVVEKIETSEVTEDLPDDDPPDDDQLD